MKKRYRFAVFLTAAAVLFAILLIPKAPKAYRDRAFGALSCAALMAVAFVALFTNPRVYNTETANRQGNC